MQGLSDVGRQNAEFATNYIRSEGIALTSSSLGGDRARRVQFWPVNGRARQRLLEDSRDLRLVEEVVQAPQRAAESGALELF
jgi:chemotaxis protein CheD